MKKEITCTVCPMGCTITVEGTETEVTSISGFTCKRGETYAKTEAVNPVRVVTSSVPVTGNPAHHMVSVKTKGDVPKAKVRDVVDALKGLTVESPVAIGDVVLADAAGTGVDIIATRNV